MKKRASFIVLVMLLLAALSMNAAAAAKKKAGWYKTKKGEYYYVLSSGKIAKGWLKYRGEYYYCDPANKGIRKTGWVKYKNNYYFCDPQKNGARKTGWLRRGRNYYYLIPEKSGRMCVGWRKINGKFYRFASNGRRVTGWMKLNNRYYYLDPKKSGAMAQGWYRIGRRNYYFTSMGIRCSGWLKYRGGWYYLRPNANGALIGGWYSVDGVRYYFDPYTGKRAQGTVMIGGVKHIFDENGILTQVGDTIVGSFTDYSGKVARRSSIRQMLRTALLPVGSTMYVWGGGWSASQSGANEYARTIGAAARWREYFSRQSSSYDYTKTRFQIYDGLDCSGYIGWLMYNTFNTQSGRSGFVMPAENMATTFASYGWGSYSSPGSFSDFRAGDIMSSGGHVYIVVGQCSDSSVVLIHSSPKGVMINGTYTRSGGKISEAITLATKYMRTYFPSWYAKYPDCSRGTFYLTGFGRMRWYLTSNSVMTDSEGLRNMNAAQVLKSIFA